MCTESGRVSPVSPLVACVLTHQRLTTSSVKLTLTAGMWSVAAQYHHNNGCANTTTLNRYVLVTVYYVMSKHSIQAQTVF